MIKMPAVMPTIAMRKRRVNVLALGATVIAITARWEKRTTVAERR